MAAIQLPADHAEVLKMIDRRPFLIAAISFVVTKFIPGYRTFRERLAPLLSQWVQEKIEPQPNVTDNVYQVQEEDQIANLQTCLILYTYSRGNVVHTGCLSPTFARDLNFFTIKAACESYARHTGLHKIGHKLGMALRNGKHLQRTDCAVRKYLCWLSFYCTSHQ